MCNAFYGVLQKSKLKRRRLGVGNIGEKRPDAKEGQTRKANTPREGEGKRGRT